MKMEEDLIRKVHVKFEHCLLATFLCKANASLKLDHGAEKFERDSRWILVHKSLLLASRYDMGKKGSQVTVLNLAASSELLN